MSEDKTNYFSGRYGTDSDGGVSYAENKFKASRERIDEKNKVFEVLSKLYPILKPATSIANTVLKDRAQARENELNYQFANFSILHDNGEKVRAQDRKNKEANISNKEYLVNEYTTRITEDLSEYYKNLDLSEMGPVINQYAVQYAEADLEAYNAMVSQAYDLPEWDEDGVEFRNWYEATQGRKPPQNIVQLIGNKVSDFVRGNTEETLNEEAKANPVMDQFAEYGEFEEAAKVYHGISGNGYALAQIVKTAKEQELFRGAIIGSPKIQLSPTTYNPETNMNEVHEIVTILRENINKEDRDGDGRPDDFIVSRTKIAVSSVPASNNELSSADALALLEKAIPDSPSYERMAAFIANHKGPISFNTAAYLLAEIAPQDRVQDFDDMQDIVQIILSTRRINNKNAGVYDPANRTWRINDELTTAERAELGLDYIDDGLSVYLNKTYGANQYDTSDIPVDSGDSQVEIPLDSYDVIAYLNNTTNLEEADVSEAYKALTNPDGGLLWTDRTAGGLGFSKEIEASPSQMKFVRKGIDLGAMFNDSKFPSDPVDITLEFLPGDGDERGSYFIYITPQKGTPTGPTGPTDNNSLPNF